MKLPDLEAATTTWRERQRLEQLIAESEQPSTEQIASLELRQQALIERLDQLDANTDPHEGSDAMNDVESLQKQLDDQSKQLQSLRASSRSLDTSLATSRAAQQRLQRERQDSAKEVELIGKDLEERRLSLRSLLAEHGTLEEQVLAQRDHQTVLGRAEEVLRGLQSELKLSMPPRCWARKTPPLNNWINFNDGRTTCLIAAAPPRSVVIASAPPILTTTWLPQRPRGSMPVIS